MLFEILGALQAQNPMEALVEGIIYLILLAVTVVAVAVVYLFCMRLFSGKHEMGLEYYIRLLIVSVCVVVFIGIILGALATTIGLWLTQNVVIFGPALAVAIIRISTIIGFMVVVFFVKITLAGGVKAGAAFRGSLWGTVISLFVIYLVNAITLAIFGLLVVP